MTSTRSRAALVALGLVGLALGACTTGAPAATTPTAAAAQGERAVTVRAVPVERTDLVSTANYTGDVRARSSLNVVPKGTGRVERLNVDLGSSVKAGDVIAELDKEQARLTLRQAEAGLAAARAKLGTLKAGPRPETVAQAEAGARAARARVAALEQASQAEKVAQAQAGVDAARAKLAGVQSPRPEAVGQADAAVKAAEARLEALKSGPTAEQIRSAEIGVEQAKNALYSVQVQKDAACGGGGFACEAAKRQAAAGEEAVKQAEQQLKILTAPPTAEALAQAEAGVEAARQQAALARRPASPEAVAQARNGVQQAEAALQLARQPVQPAEIAAARAQAEAAEAQARLAAQPYTKQDVEAAEAGVAQAEAQVELARTQVADLTVTAPVDGVVADRFLAVGAVTGPTVPIVSLASPEVEVTFAVEESALGRIQVGQTARIALPALGGEAVAGKVALIAPTLDNQTRTAQVKVQPDPDAIGKLRPGMFAQVTVESARRPDALVVPRSALLPGDAPSVFVVEGGHVRRAALKLGQQDRERVEVLEGLKDGDQVVIDAVDLREGAAVAVAAGR
jgi:RND family efflux transporter MFP subunit